MLEANKNNPKVFPKSSSIKLTKVDGFVIFSLNFKHVVVASYNASKSNQWLLDLFITQLITTRNKESKIIFKMCQVKEEALFHSF